MGYDVGMNESKLFRTAGESEEHAAHMVACFWLCSAHKIIEDGGKPLKLSKCSLALSKSEMDRDIYDRMRTKMRSKKIARLAMQIALAKLRDGQFPEVRKHFEVKFIPIDC